MIRRIVDFALNNRLAVVAVAVILFASGIVSFERLPIEAYPDVADNYVDVITQWPGISAGQNPVMAQYQRNRRSRCVPRARTA